MKMKQILSLILTWVIIPLFLLAVWFGSSLLFISKYSFSVVAIPHERSDFRKFQTTELLAKQKIGATFQAKENNLGIVSVRFYNFQRISKDKVIFRIKEKNQKSWFYENTYKVDQFQPDQLFTFGFPVIPDSQGKIYYFEVESTRGRRGDAVALSEVYPPFVSQYQFPKEVLLADKVALFQFFLKKIYYSFTDRNLLMSSLVYLLPLVFYLIWCYIAKVVIGISISPFPQFQIHSRRIVSDSVKNGYVLVQIYLLILSLLIVGMDEKNVFVTVMLIGLWIWLIRLYRFDSSVSYLLSFAFMLLSSALLLVGQAKVAERAAMWVYFFLLIGTVIAFLELTKRIKMTVNYESFLQGNYTSLRNYVRQRK